MSADLAKKFIELIETGQPNTEIFTEDVFVDVNVPAWRFQMAGAPDFFGWMREEIPDGVAVESWREFATHDDAGDGFGIEMVQTTPDYARQVWLFRTRGDRISEATFYCTGPWDAETLARQRAEAPMLRP